VVIGETLSHYRVLERLGSGGMGDVYRAEDLRLRRVVALKMLRDHGLGDKAARRLLAEARAASALNHPNIAVVYETSEVEHDGRRVGYIAMEYVEGTTLAAVIGQGPVDLDRILDVVEQIVDALAEAHEHGIVHCDLKPSNVMLTPGGRVKVLDFGVAQRRETSFAAPDDATRTAEVLEGAAGFMGTLPYVAPEQATGREVDGRADIYSLGVMFYELVCGKPPFTGSNAARTFEAMLRDDVPPFPDPARDARLPQLERLVRRMLARDADRRMAGLADVREALRAIRSGGRLPDALDPTSEARSVAVAGFVNISGNPEDDWLGAGISETLTADAGQLEGVSVVSRERVSELLKTLGRETGERVDRLFLRAGRELRARWVVSGAFQRSGDAVRVTASLTDVATGHLIATTKVDGGLHAIFELQDRLVRELAGALRAAGTPDVSASPETEVVEAYEAFSRGLLNRSAQTFESLDRAVWLLERAVSLDPAYARAHVELGAAYATKADYLSMPELRGRAASSFRRALELQPSSARAWRELGAVLVDTGQEADGMAAIRRALAIDPEDAAACAAMARGLFIGLARFRDAADWFSRALELNARGGWYALQLAHCAALLRDFALGERAAARAMELQEAFLSGREGLFIAGGYIRAGHLAALQGRHADAIAHFQREIDFLARTEHALRNRILVELNARLGAAYLQLGDVHKAHAVFNVALEGFERRVRLGADDPFTRYYAAAVHALRGDAEPALAFLERAITEKRAFTIARARIEPEFDGLRSDPRFQRLVEPAGRAAI
jgi:TolB-like protein/tRNA A-37 threonylcarbamoyl transferase component Bud32/Tfp pilus assembly protein PilF